MIIYTSAHEYIDTASSLKDQIAKVQDVIDSLLDTAVKAASGDNITEYSVDDGQVKIQTVYKGVDAIARSVEAFTKIKQMLIAQYNSNKNGRMIRLVDSKNFPNAK
jgi:hypothetical protein